MINFRKYLIYIYIICLLQFSCEKQTDWDIQASQRFPVAECIITNELKCHEVKIYWSSDKLNQALAGISGVEVKISDGNSSYLFEEDTNKPGTYVSSVAFMATAGLTYQLVVSFNGNSDTAWAEMTAINPMETLEITSSDSLYRFIYHESSLPSMAEIYYDWAAVPAYCENYGACTASETYYTLKNIDVNKIFAPDKTIVKFPRGTQIIRRKYSLNEAHQDFLRSLLIETEWRGGIFDVEQGNVPTNFHRGVKGWFAACMVLSDTTLFN